MLAGPSAPVLFPVPWARTPETSFLVQPRELRELLLEAGVQCLQLVRYNGGRASVVCRPGREDPAGWFASAGVSRIART